MSPIPTVYLSYANDSRDSVLEHLRKEKEGVEDALIRVKGLVHPLLSENAELASVIKRLGEKSFVNDLVVFGFSGHAGGERLIFSDADARGAGLATLMRRENCPHLKLVLLNGCVTHEHLRFFEEIEVPIVITTNVPVPDKSAAQFSVTLFERLVQGDTAYQAYVHAIGNLGTTKPVKECTRCYTNGDSISSNYSAGAPVWEFAYREERFKQWTLSMGKSDPIDRGTFLGSPAEAIRLLFLGDEYFEIARGRFLDKIEAGWLAVATLPLKTIIEGDIRLKEEIEHAHAVILHINEEEANPIFRTQKSDWFIREITTRRITTVFLRDVCSDANLDTYKAKFDTSNVILIPALLELSWIREYPSKHIASEWVCKDLEDKVIAKLIQGNSKQKNGMLEILEKFDLSEQRSYLGEIPVGNKVNCVVIEGTTNCGLELLLKKTLKYLSIRREDCRRVKFDAQAGGISGKASLYVAIQYAITEVRKDVVSKSALIERLCYKLEGDPVCLIFDNPLAVVEKGVILSLWEDIRLRLLGENDMHPFNLIILNKGAGDSACRISKQDFPESAENDGKVFIFPMIKKIEENDFNFWWGSHAPQLREQYSVQNLNNEKLQLLSYPYLGAVLEKLCMRLGQANLITELLPKY